MNILPEGPKFQEPIDSKKPSSANSNHPQIAKKVKKIRGKVLQDASEANAPSPHRPLNTKKLTTVKENAPQVATENQPAIESAQAVDFNELILAKDKELLVTDINNAMKKIQNQIVNNITDASSAAIRKSLKGKHGRDWMVYAPLASFKNDLLGLVTAWNEKDWSLESTMGLLMDLAIAAKDVPKLPMNEELSKPLWDTRKEKHAINRSSQWVDELKSFGVDQTKDLQAGPSLSTAQVLRFLRLLGKTDGKETEAIVNGLIHYWRSSKLKQWLGQYHTPVEVWAAYTHHLEREYAKALIQQHIKNNLE